MDARGIPQDQADRLGPALEKLRSELDEAMATLLPDFRMAVDFTLPRPLEGEE